MREVVAAYYFGVTGAMSAFTIAFQVPNLIRALFADSALQGAFVPVFSELLEKGERKEAFRVASSLFFLICLILGAVTALFILFADPLMSLFAPGFDDNPALTLSFGKFKEGQECFGLRKLHLNNSVQDRTRLDELIASRGATA